jgi:putative DNA primase/helicase
MKGLIGKRLNIIEEVEGNFYHSNKLKKLISGEPVTIDIKYKDQFTFRPQAKFVFAVNMIPRIDDSSTATERRMLVVHFKNNFQETGNSSLRGGRGELAKELSGILNWMISGALSLRERNKFTITDEHIKLLQEYRMENSSVEGFIGECLIFGEGYSEATRELYDEYKNYCSRDGRKFKGNIAFTKEMKTYGIRYKRFTFEPRQHGKDSNKFIGVKIDNSWSQARVAQATFNSF